MDANLAKEIAQYVALRDCLAKVDEKWEAERKKYTALMDKLSGRIQAFLTEHGLENIKTDGGTAYVSSRWTASLKDPQAFMDFVKSTGNLDLLDRRANVTVVKDYVKKNNELPPGCALSCVETVNIRRPTKV